MDFLKKHYEKIVLSIVLLSLALAAAYLPFQLQAVVRDIEQEIGRGSPKIFQPMESDPVRDIRTDRVQRLADAEHNLFNPVGWTLNQHGSRIKDPYYRRRGPEALLVMSINPLHFRIAFEKTQQEENDTQYHFGVTREGDPKRSNRRRMSRQLRVGGSNDIFDLVNVTRSSGSRELTFEINLQEDRRAITFQAGKPFQEVVGYSVDLIYPPDNNRKYQAKRVGDKLTLARQTYEIVVVTESEVVIKDYRTTKQTRLSLNGN